MMLLRKKVLKLIDLGHTRAEIAKEANISASTMGRFVDGGSIEFYAALLMIRAYWKEEEKAIVHALCQDTKLKNPRVGLEYAKIRRDFELSELLIQRLKAAQGRHDQEWASVYEIELMRVRDKISPQEVIAKLENVNFETLEMKLYAKILLSYAYHDLKRFDRIKDLYYDVTLKLPQIHNEWIRKCYSLRLGQVMSFLHLYDNELAQCRSCIQSLAVTDVTDSSLAASLFHILGYSYMLEDAEEALHHLRKSRDIYSKVGRANAQRSVENTINFVQTLHGFEAEYIRLTDNIQDISNVAFYHIQKGDKEAAEELLERISWDTLTNYQKAFQYYYRGRLTGDHTYYFKSISEFKLAGNVFLRQLPIQELRKPNQYNEEMLRALSL